MSSCTCITIRRRKHPHRGTALYITVLSTALIVSLLGLTGMTIMRVERRQATSINDRLIARANARSAVELALLKINQDADWRTTYTNGVETAPLALGPPSAGTCSFVIEDSDGSLSDGDTHLRLKGVGRVGDALQVSSVGLTPSGEPLSCLEIAASANGLIEFESGAQISSNQTFHSNSSVTSGTNTVVNADVEATGVVSGPGYNRTVVSPVSPREFPASSMFDHYLAIGTPIPFTAIPKVGPTKSITGVLLSPANNPYGPVNSQGVYVIDCGGLILRVEYARIVGTLVLINPHPQSDIFDVSWEPAINNYPALLVQGSVEFRVSDGVLDEASGGVNFNPPGSPYLGLSDDDQTDTYPSRIKGIVYLSGDTYVNDLHLRIEGALVSGGLLNVNASDSLTVTYNPAVYSNPPPGFSVDDKFTITPGSWLWDGAE